MATFLGASDAEEEGQWKWLDGSAFDFMRWTEGEPNGGSGENCLWMNGTSVGQGGWGDISCSEDNPGGLSFVCSYDAGK